MNDRKRAWQILHTEIRRHTAENPDMEAWANQLGALVNAADSLPDLILDLACFGATFATMNREDPLADADRIGALIMGTPDEVSA
jgi:hypothetical protein